jgi:hypothetical protein
MARIESTSNSVPVYDSRFVNVTGDTMTGSLAISGANSRLGVGITPTTSNGYLQLPASTTHATGGIAWGTDVNLYRVSANILQTDDSFNVGNGANSVNMNLKGIGYNGTTVSVYSDTTSAYSFFFRYMGTFAAPTQVLNNSYLGSFGFRGANDTGVANTQDGARFSAITEEDVTTLTQKTALVFYTNPTGSVGATERMRISGDGKVRLGASAVLNGKLNLDSNTVAAGGIYFGTDTTLYRSAAAILSTDGAFYATSYVAAQRGTANQVFVGAKASGTPAAGILFGSAFDTNIYRSAAGVVTTDGSFTIAIGKGLVVGDSAAPIGGGLLFARSGTNEPFIRLRTGDGATAGSQIRGINGGGVKITDDTGGTPWFTVTTAGNALVAGALGVGNSAAATTLGTVVKKMEVFNATGTSLGFVPIYDTIT